MLGVDGSSGTNGSNKKHWLGDGDDSRPSPGLPNKTGGVGVMAIYHGKNDQAKYGPTPDASLVDNRINSLAVQQRMDQKGDGDVSSHHTASGGSSAAGLASHCQVV